MLHRLRRLLSFCRRGRLDDELAEEIRLHLELRRRAFGRTFDPSEDLPPLGTAVAVGAAWLPARRAARVDPILTLRGE